MRSTLVVFFLSVQSSYSENTEAPATEEAFDTVQFFAADGRGWRIKTHARDEDVHIWSLGDDVPNLVDLAVENTQEHYGDVLAEGYVIENAEGLDGIRQELQVRGLAPNLETPPSGAVFWGPPGTRYRTKSSPK